MPLLPPAIVSGWLFIFLLGAKELSMSVLLARSPLPGDRGGDVRPVGERPEREVVALGLVWTLFMAGCTLVFYAFAAVRCSAWTEGKAQ